MSVDESSKLKELRDLIQSDDDKRSQNSPKPGIIWMSRIPPGMDYARLRAALSIHGEITRIHLQSEDDHKRTSRIKGGGTARKLFRQGWIEFKRKRIARLVAESLNATAIGKRRCTDLFQGDLWNLKYLPRFKWEHLESYLRDARRSRTQRRALALAVAEKERSHFLEQLSLKNAIAKKSES